MTVGLIPPRETTYTVRRFKPRFHITCISLFGRIFRANRRKYVRTKIVMFYHYPVFPQHIPFYTPHGCLGGAAVRRRTRDR